MLPNNFEYNNKFFRYGIKDRQWAIGHEWTFKGQIYRIAHYGDWSTGETNTWKSYDEKQASLEFKRKEKESLEEIKITVDLEKEKIHSECSKEWSSKWVELPDPGSVHDYLISKGLMKSYGSKLDERGTLLIQVVNETGIAGVQKIYKDFSGFQKRFSTGIKKKGSFSFIGDYKTADHLYLCEGFATACSIYEATGLPVVIGLDAGNLFEAIKNLRSINNKCKIILCADLDKNRIGQAKAYYCKKFFRNIIVKEPKFTIKSDKQTDFNDLHCSEGLDTLTEQLKFTDNEFTYIKYLGYDGHNFYYSSSENHHVIGLTSANHTKNNLFSLAPMEFWTSTFANEEGKISWDHITSHMMQKCRAEPTFNPEMARGVGVWIDNGIVTVNNGEELIPDVPSSKYYYEKIYKYDVDLSRDLSDEDSLELIDLFRKLPCKYEYDYMYIFAWFVQSQIFECLDWRCHLWLTAERGAGKSKILSWIESISTFCVKTEDSTSAGVAQTIKNDAIPVIYDEAEAEKVGTILDLARLSSSRSNGKTMRGTPSGKATSYRGRGIFLFGSIQPAPMKGSDLSRFFVVELKKKKNRDEYLQMVEGFKKFAAKKKEIFARIVSSVDQIKESINIAKDVLSESDLDARQCDQISLAMACLWSFKSNKIITKQECIDLIFEMRIMYSDYVAQNEETDFDMCLHDLLAIETDHQNTNIGQIINILKSGPNSECDRILSTFGLRYFKEDSSLFIASRCPKTVSKMKTYPAYKKVLSRSEKGIRTSDNQVVAGRQTKGIRLLL